MSVFSVLGKAGKGVLDVVAPTVASALPGPLGPIARKAVSELLDISPEASAEDIEAALAAASPETLLRLRELDAQIAQLEMGDRASARTRQAAMRDWTPNILGVVAILGYAGLQYVLVTQELPPGNEDLIIRSIGIIEGAFVTVWAYFFGSSAGSKVKTLLNGK